MATLELEHVSKRYSRNVWGLHPTDLRAEEHEFLVLLGPSGCGKSTTVRLVAGLERTDSGSIRIAGVDVTDLPPRKRHVSMVFQNYAVWPHMTVAENIGFALRLRRLPQAEIRRTIREMAELVHIGDLLERHPSQLSGGQRQRVALARALAVQPRVFLMDEPLSNLDAKLRGQMRTELKTIHRQTGATTLFVTHDQAEAMSVADRIVVMNQGTIVQTGTPEDVYCRSATAFVAGFIGSPPANFFTVEVRQDGAGFRLEHPAFSLAPGPDWNAALARYRKRRLLLAIRPEDIRVAGTETATLTADLLAVEPQGSHQILAFDVQGILTKALMAAGPKIAPSTKVPLAFDPVRVQMFDIDDDTRLALSPGAEAC